jgi:hypothetical protein
MPKRAVMSSERERSRQLFFDWLANRKIAEDMISELLTQDELVYLAKVLSKTQNACVAVKEH